MPTREDKFIDPLSEKAIHMAYSVRSFLQAPSISGDMRQLLQTWLLRLKPLMKPGIAAEFLLSLPVTYEWPIRRNDPALVKRSTPPMRDWTNRRSFFSEFGAVQSTDAGH